MLTIVVPVYNEAPGLAVLINSLRDALGSIPEPYETIFVNDGSRDNTGEILRRYCAQDPRIKLINLTKNFGHQNAILAGIDYAQGDALVIMDADLQDPPEMIPKFYEKWKEEGYQVVYGIRREREAPLLLRLGYRSFYKILYKIAYIEIPLDAGDFCLMDREVYFTIRQLPENVKFVRGLRSWTGGRQIGIPYRRPGRRSGQSKYSLVRLLGLAVRGFTSFSFYPLYLIGFIGVVSFALSLVGMVVYILQKFLIVDMISGFSSIMVSIFFFSGLQMISLGVVGVYLAHVYQEVKRRPPYLIRDLVNMEEIPR